MPKVITKKKNSAGEPYSCARCSEKIVAGQEYLEWSFRYGGTRRQHKSHGHPRASQLTQSKMSGAYAATEGLEDEMSSATELSDLSSARDTCVEELRSVASEYEESINNMPDALQQGPTAEEMNEKVEALNSLADELEGVDLDNEADELDREEGESDEDFEQRVEDSKEEHFNERREELQTTLDNGSL